MPGAYGLRTIAHFGVKQRSPLRKSFSPARRHNLHFASRYRPIIVCKNLLIKSNIYLNAPRFSRSTPVMRDRRDILDHNQIKTVSRKAADRRFAPASNALDIDIQFFCSEFSCFFRNVMCDLRCGIWRGFFCAFKSKRACAAPCKKPPAHVQCTYNNTIISITDMRGGLLAWGSAGALGFKGAKKSTPYAATQVAHDVAEKTRKFGTKELDVYIKGVGSGREASIRGLAGNGFDLIMIKDITPIPHNGCRPRKPRRV